MMRRAVVSERTVQDQVAAITLLPKIGELPDIRVEKVAEAKAMIADGTLDTPENMDAVVDNVADEITVFEGVFIGTGGE